MIKLINEPNYVNIIDVDDSKYFSNEYSDYISNSKLSLINPEEGGSPEKYKSGLSNNKIFSNAMEFGSAIHQLILQPEEYGLIEEIDKPSGKLSFVVDYLLSNNLNISNDDDIIIACNEFNYFTNKLTTSKISEIRDKITEFYEYIIKHSNDDLSFTPIYLSSYDKFRCKECLSSLMTNHKVQKLLYPKDADSFNEATFLSELEVNIYDNGLLHKIFLKFKGKLDNFTVDSNKLILNDLKTTGHEISKFTNSFEKYRYARQVAMYLFFLKHIYPEINEIESNIIAVQTMSPFTSHVFPISLDSIKLGMKEASNLIKMVTFFEFYGFDKTIEDYERFTV